MRYVRTLTPLAQRKLAEAEVNHKHEVRGPKQLRALTGAQAIHDQLMAGPEPQDGLNPALPHGTDDDAGFGITIYGIRYYVTVTVVN